MSIETSPTHRENALWPIETTLLGMLIVMSEEHPENDCTPMDVTFFGITR